MPQSVGVQIFVKIVNFMAEKSQCSCTSVIIVHVKLRIVVSSNFQTRGQNGFALENLAK